MSDKDILYELKELHQWKLDREVEDSKEFEFRTRLFQKFDIRRFLPQKNKDIFEYYNSQLPWQFAVSNSDRTLLAVLQENYLEIRHKRNDYEKPIGRISVPQDQYPQWRKLTWSSDGICIALSTSSGELRCYNTLTTLICSIPKIDDSYDSSSFRPNGAISALFLIDARTKNAEWPYELIAIDFNGSLRSYFVSSNEGYKPYHNFSFGDAALTSAAYISTFNILVVAFPRSSLSCEFTDNTLGLSSWRLLIDHPYYRLVKPGSENLTSSSKQRGWLSWLTNKNKTCILKMCVSLNVKYLACMHSCGSVSVWTLPQLSMQQMWPSQNLPQYEIIEGKKNGKSESTQILMDIGWCLDSKLVILYKKGTLTVSSLESLDNLLARINPKCHIIERQPESFHAPARLANICDMTIGFLVLNHERKEFSSWRRESESSETNFEEDSLSKSVELADNHSLMRQILRFLIHFEFLHQQKKLVYVEKTYKLTVLKNVTPVELYEQKINSEEYMEALDFAKLFNLDENRVYKKQWLNSCPVTVESIDDHLLKISDKKWIIYQCCERIPENLEAAEMLLKKGLECTDFSEFILDDQILETEETELYELKDAPKFEFNLNETSTHFSKNQLNILKKRKYLLSYWDALIVYKKILSLNATCKTYDQEEYRKFRNQSPLSLALSFAHEGNSDAVFVLFTYYGEELAPYWLQVLDNVPECIAPSSYKKLLPKFNDQNKLELWQYKRIRPAEWSESGDFKDLITRNPCPKYTSNETSSLFTKKEITEWYEKKIREIVDGSGLIDYALELLNLATKNNISGLENVRHNLLVLDQLTYELLLDDDFSLAEMEKRSDLDKLILLMSEFTTRESFKKAITQILLPFLNRCETLRSNSKDALLDAYFKRLSENDLMLPFTFFEHMNEKDKHHLLFSAKKKFELRLLCVCSCTRTDQIEIAMKIIEIEPEFSDNNNSCVEETMNLRSRLREVHTELVAMQLLRKYGFEKNITFIHASKQNEQFQKEVFTSMVNAEIDKSSSSRQEIYTLYDDMTFLQENLFGGLFPQTYLRIFAYTMLTAGRCTFIENYAPLVLSCSAAKKNSTGRTNTLTFNESVSIIVEAAQYYFNTASSYDDLSISLANACLSLITFHPDLERERRLIDALKMLSDFGVQVTPLKVRMCVGSKKILEKVLKVKTKAYKDVDQLMFLAANIQNEDCSREDLEVEVLNLVVEAAFKVKDYVWCSSIVAKLMEKGKSCWILCKKLCQCDEYEDLEMKQTLIKYALMQCPDEELVFLVELRNKIECHLLQRKLKRCLAQKRESSVTDNSATGNPKEYSTECENRKEPIESYQTLISIPALMNMLHTSSSHVLNVNFWKNTFNFNPESYNDPVERNINTEFRKFTFPEFYSDILESKECICRPSNSSGETEILQQLLRYYLLRSKDGDVENVTETNIEDVIVQFAVSSFSDDCLVCLSLLLLFKETDYSEKVFVSWPSTTVVQKFALYYYSLRFLVDRNVAVHDIVTNEPPSALVSQALMEAKNAADSKYTALIMKYKNALEKRRNVNKLQDLGCGIDSTRFFHDETYKMDSILGLAMYEERDKLDLALRLGAVYGVSSEDIVLSHIKSLFLSGNITQLTARFKEQNIVDTLKQNPLSAAEKLVAEIYGGLFGCDYQILLMYYALLNQIAEDSVFHHLRPKEHMKLLRKLKAFTKQIDYKMLTSEQFPIIESVMPAVFSTEIDPLVNFFVSLPSPLKENIDLEEVFEKLAEKIFFNAPADQSYEERFQRLLPLLDKISKHRVSQLIQKYLFSKYSCENIDLNTRRAILDVALVTFSKKDDEDFICNLKKYSQHITKIEEFNEICRAVDIDDMYSKDLQRLIVSDSRSQLNEVIVKMVLDFSVSTDMINVILEFVRAGSLPDVISDLLNSDLNKDSIGPLLRRIENCLEDNEFEKCWSDQLKSLLNDESISKVHGSYMKKILAILELPDADIYNAIERLHETRLILREWVTVFSRITLFDVVGEEQRQILMEKLVRLASSLAQFCCLVKLLTFWPRFTDTSDWKKNQWMLLAEKVLALREDEIPSNAVLNLFQEIIDHANLNKEMKRAFFEYISSLPHNRVLLVWFCILADDDLLVQSVSGYISELKQTKQMPTKIEDFLKRKDVS